MPGGILEELFGNETQQQPEQKTQPSGGGSESSTILERLFPESQFDEQLDNSVDVKQFEQQLSSQMSDDEYKPAQNASTLAPLEPFAENKSLASSEEANTLEQWRLGFGLMRGDNGEITTNVNHLGEEKPFGATGWDYNGEAYYGPGISGFWNKLQSKLNAPVGRGEVASDLPVIQNRMTQQATPMNYRLSNKTVNLANAMQNFSTKAMGDTKVGTEPMKASTLAGVTLLVRRLSDIAVKDVALGGLTGVTKLAEQTLGAAEGLSEAGEGAQGMSKPLSGFDLDNDQTPDWSEQIIENIWNTSIPGLGYNAIRAIIAPGTFDQKWDKVNKGWVAGNLQYTGLFDVTRKAELVRRYMAGEDPALLTVELENPVAETIGQMIVDPLNAVDWIGGALAKSGKIAKAARVAEEVPLEIDNILKATKAATDPDGLRALKTASEAVMAHSGKVRNGLSDLSQATGLAAPLANTKRGWVLGRSAETLAILSGNADNAEDVIGMYGTLAKLASNSADEVADALAEVGHYGKTARSFLTERALESGVLLRKIIGETTDGALDLAGFASDFQKHQKKALSMVEEGQDALSAQAYMGQMLGERLHKVVDGMFPKAIDMKTLPGYLRPIAAANEAAMKVYAPVNSFFAGVYFSSPGFAFRNLMNNFLTTAVDEGLETAVSIFNPKNNERITAELMGDAASQIMRSVKGFGGGGISQAADVKAWGWGMKFSENMEKWTAAAITRRAVVDTFDKMMTKGRGIPMLDRAIAKGLAPEAADHLYDMIRANNYNVKAAVAQFREAAATGSIDRVRNLETILGKDVMIDLNTWGAEQEVRKAVTRILDNGGTVEEAAAEVEKIRKAVLKPAEGVLDEAVSVPREAFQAEDIPIVEAADVSAGLKELHTDRIAANHVAKQSNQKVVGLIDDALTKALAEAGQTGDVKIAQNINNLKQKIDAAWKPVENANGVESQVFRQSYYPFSVNLKKIKSTKEFNPLKEWNKLDGMAKAHGITLTRPEELNYQTLNKAFWEEFFFPAQNEIGRKHVQEFAKIADDAANGLRKTGIDMPTLEQVVEQAKTDTAFAEAWSNFIPDEILVFEMADARNAGRNVDVVRLLGKQFGVETATAKGVPADQKLLNIINKNLPAESKFANLADVPEAVAREQLQNWHFARSFKERGLEYKPFVSGLVEGADDATVAAQKAVMAEVPDANPKLPKPYAGGTPSPQRVLYESRAAVNKAFKIVDAKLRENWGVVDNVVVDEGVDGMITEWANEVEANVTTTRLAAAEYAYQARKFTLLDYTSKYGFDAALQYAMPYQFWYSRSYANWGKRLVTNPGAISEYALYKQHLAKIHADQPEWFRYNVSSNELLGIDAKNPLYFNLEATLWPLNGLTGVDFEDPNRRVNWWTTALDDIGKFGPSLWTPINAAVALTMKAYGEDEAASAWGGRLIPQTAPLKAALALTNTRAQIPGVTGLNEFDPFVNFFSGGLDPYERRRVGKAVEGMLANGEISPAQAAEAMYTQKGKWWDEGIMRATKLRAPGQLSSFFLGVGFKGRTQEDIQIERMDTERQILMARKADMTPEEYRAGWQDLESKYPYLDYVTLSRKSGLAKDEAYSYMVLDRLPPGQASDLLDMSGINADLVEKFYATKGFDGWAQGDVDTFMQSIVNLGAAFDAPDDATKQEWIEAKNRYRTISETLRKEIDPDIQFKIDNYYDLKAQDSNKAQAYMDANPDVGDALDIQKQLILNDPLLSKYYGAMSKVESYFKSQLKDFLESKSPANIQDVLNEYNSLVDKKERDKYYDAHPEIATYYDLQSSLYDTMYDKLAQTGNIFRDGPSVPVVRKDANQTSAVVKNLIEQSQQPQEPSVYDVPLDEWKGQFTDYSWRLIEDNIRNGDELSMAMENNLARVAAKYDIDDSFLLALIRQKMTAQQ